MMEYRHIPHVVDAQKFTGGVIDSAAILKWISSNGGKAVWCGAISPHVKSERQKARLGLPENLQIRTKKGWQLVPVGGYVILNVQGEFEYCPSDIFERDYESTLAAVVDITPITSNQNNIA